VPKSGCSEDQPYSQEKFSVNNGVPSCFCAARRERRMARSTDIGIWLRNRRVAGGQVVQRQVLYLGEINDSQQEVWRKSIEVFEDGRSAPRTVALFAEDQRAPVDDEQVIQVRLKDLTVRNARQWGACWLACELYEQLKLDQFWAERLPPSRKGTRWDLI